MPEEAGGDARHKLFVIKVLGSKATVVPALVARQVPVSVNPVGLFPVKLTNFITHCPITGFPLEVEMLPVPTPFVLN